MTKKDIVDAYLWIRSNNQTIPDDVLNFMKETSIERLEEIEESNKRPCDCYKWPAVHGGFGKPMYCSNCLQDL